MKEPESLYIIRGGIQGRERLRILARVSWPATLSLLQQTGLRAGMTCLDVGCGGGDVSFELARLVEPGGRVVGIDMDQVKIEMAKHEAEAQHLTNIDFRVANLDEWDSAPEFDLAHARFVLSHLQTPEKTLAKIRDAVRPGGVLVVADTNFAGYFSYPDSPAIQRFVELYTQTLQRRGGDANLGLRLPELLMRIGLERVQMNVVQRAAMSGDVKLLTPLTAEFSSNAIIAEGLASEPEIGRLVDDLYKFANDPNTVVSGPRIIETWGYKSAMPS